MVATAKKSQKKNRRSASSKNDARTGKHLNILMIEDMEDDADLVARHLGKQGFNIDYRRVDTEEGLHAALDERSWDIVLCDHTMPAFSVPSALRVIRDRKLDVPVIVVTGTVNEENAASVMNAGAQDLVLKNNLFRLGRAIERELREAENRRSKSQIEAKLKMQQNMLHHLMANIPDSIYFKDTQHRYIHLNHVELKVLNADRLDSVIGKPADAFLPPERARMRESEEENIFKSGKSLIDRLEKIERQDGGMSWLSATKAPIRDESGKIIGLVGITRDVTRMKQAEEALRDSEAFFRAIVDYAPGALVIKDPDGRNLLANKTFCSWYGTAAVNIVGKTHETFLSTEAVERVRAQERKVRETKAPIQEERRVTYPDGVTRDVLVQKFPILHDRGELRAIGTLITNISKRKRVEEALRDSEARFRSITQSINDAIIAIDDEGKVIQWNKGADKMFGYEETEMLGLPLSKLIPEQYRKRHDSAVERARQTGKTHLMNQTLELSALRKDGSEFPVEISLGTWMSEGKTYFSGVIRDITERKQAGEALKESEARFRDFATAASDWFWEMDDALRFTYLSDQYKRVTGQDPTTVLGKSRQEVADADVTDENWKRHLADLAARRPFHDFTFVAKEADGKIRHIRTSGVPFFDDAGNFGGYRGTATDVTDRMEEQKILKQAEKMESLGNLAGGIAHDFNNMLLPILALTKLTIKKLPEDSEHRDKLEKVVQAATRAKDLVAQILAFSRQEESQQKNLDVVAVVNEVLGLLRTTLPSTIKLKESLLLESGQVLADAAQIGTVLLNLGSNAADAMDGKPGVLEISLTRADIGEKRDGELKSINAGAYAKVQIKDTGHGMDEATVKRIFEPFFTTKAVGKGTGLGLATAYGIINKHGGVIDVSSKIGVGTTFDIYLPLVQESA